MRKAVFIDRDGVLNEDPGFLHEIDKLKFYPGIIDTLVELSKTDYLIVIVTNQPGIGRGIYSETEYKKFENAYMDELGRISKNRIRIDRIYYCPHHPTKGIGKYKTICKCRKPAPGMLKRAAEEYDIDFFHSYMIGDKRSDIQAGKAVGCKTVLVRTGCGGKGGDFESVEPDYILDSLAEFGRLNLNSQFIIQNL